MASGLALLSSLPARAQILVDGTFPTGQGAWVTQPGSNPWFGFSTSGSPDGVGGFAYLGSANLGSPDGISQQFADTPGQGYQLQYFLQNQGGSNNLFYAQMDGVTLAGSAISNTASTSLMQFDLNFTGTGSDTVAFYGANPPSQMNLGDISVTATPELDTNSLAAPLALAISGLLMFQGRRKGTL